MARWLIAVVIVAVVLALLYEWDTFNPESIRGKQILITGASSGIGEELAYQYSKLGASVVITARRTEQLQKVVSKCKELGAHKVEYVVADMGKPEDRVRVITETEKHLGGLDHLILNHAMYHIGHWLGSAENMTRLQRFMEVNFVSFVDIASRALPMLKKSNGNIGVVSSLLGKVSSPPVINYATSKFALQGFFGSLRQELKHRNSDVSVTVCVLGYIATDSATEMIEAHFKQNATPVKPASVEEAALAILKGVTMKSYEIYYPSYIKLLLFVQKLIPGYFEDFFASVTSDSAS